MSQVKAFLDFIRKQGVVGLAIGFILGGAVNQLVSSFVKDIFEPVLAIIVGSPEGLGELSYKSINYGQFLLSFIDFLILAFAVYLIFKVLPLEQLDDKK